MKISSLFGRAKIGEVACVSYVYWCYVKLLMRLLEDKELQHAIVWSAWIRVLRKIVAIKRRRRCFVVELRWMYSFDKKYDDLMVLGETDLNKSMCWNWNLSMSVLYMLVGMKDFCRNLTLTSLCRFGISRTSCLVKSMDRLVGSIPRSHTSPIQKGVQSQSNPPFLFTHVPPFWHGFVWPSVHSLTSDKRKIFFIHRVWCLKC